MIKNYLITRATRQKIEINHHGCPLCNTELLPLTVEKIIRIEVFLPSAELILSKAQKTCKRPGSV